MGRKGTGPSRQGPTLPHAKTKSLTDIDKGGTVEDGKRFRKKLDIFREKLLQTGDYNTDGDYIHSKKKL